MKMNAYSANRQRNRWRDNSLERADENTSGKFDWYIIRKFRPYVGRYKGWTLASVILMLLYTVFNLANPYLIGVAIDQFIGHNDWRPRDYWYYPDRRKRFNVASTILAGMDDVLGRAANTLQSQFGHVYTPATTFAQFL